MELSICYTKWLLGLHEFLFFIAANEQGETPIDIAKRLKHTHCEDLVSLYLLYSHNTLHIIASEMIS